MTGPVAHKLWTLLRALLVALLCSGPGLAQVGSAGFERLMSAGKGGDADAQRQLGDMLRLGASLPQNYAQAANWYALAAAQGDAAAQNGLAALFAAGLGVEADPARAFELFTQAAASGEAKYLHDLASVYEQGIGTEIDPLRAVDLYRRAADLGWQESQVSLGVMYQSGIGVDPDIVAAIELYTGPAVAGHVRAQNNLGLIYVRGEGVERDYTEAAKWLGLAAAQGLPVALSNLGVLYQNGFGVPEDEDEANRLYKLAAQISGGGTGLALIFDPRLQAPDPSQVRSYLASAQAGDPVGQFLLGYVLADNAQTGAQYRVAADWLEQAANAGIPAAMANFGLLTFEGKGALQDFVEGYKWLSIAALGGLPGVIEARDRLAARMTSGQINAANAAAEAALPMFAAHPSR